MAETRKTGDKQEVVVTGNAVAKDEGTISVTYNPGPGDPKESEIFGKKVKAGQAVDVPAEYAHKVRGNPYLSMKGEKPDSKQEAKQPEPQEEASFEDNLARERSEEYLSGRPLFANTAPGEAERVARAQEAAAELKAAVEDEDKDDKSNRRGR